MMGNVVLRLVAEGQQGHNCATVYNGENSPKNRRAFQNKEKYLVMTSFDRQANVV